MGAGVEITPARFLSGRVARAFACFASSVLYSEKQVTEG